VLRRQPITNALPERFVAYTERLGPSLGNEANDRQPIEAAAHHFHQRTHHRIIIMGTKYTTTTITGYNSSPPPDDGSTGSDNIVAWSGVKTKIGDPVKSAVESMDSKLATFVDVGPVAKTANYTTVAGDHLKTLECTNTITVSLLDAGTAGAGYTVGIFNAGSGTVTVSRVTGANTINGSASDITLAPKKGVTLRVIAAATGYVTIDSASSDIASLARTDSGFIVGDGTNFVLESGATARTSMGLGSAAEKNTGTSGNNVPLLDGANTWSADQTIQSTDAGAGAGPILALDRASASPAANDFLGQLQFRGRSDTGANIETGGFVSRLIDPTNGSETANFEFRSRVSGSSGSRLILRAGLYTASATGGDKGAGTINAAAFYENGVRMDVQGVAKAWARVEASTGTVSVDDSFNVTSVTDNGVGDYTINFTTAFANANYAFLGMGRGAAGGTSFIHIGQNDSTAPSTTACRITTANANNSPQHPAADADFSVAFFGDQ
jgi:hypothetical protein